MVRKLLVGIAAAVSLSLVGGALAASADSGTGRPNQSCQVTTVTPGNAANAPGSPFNPAGQSGTVYAGQQPQNSQNGQASQYDVACANQTNNH